ncbi:sugar ABC transporter permease [Chloroflexia bacterium SDU3-3]|nr:sugar ABC transporter permease [Chloroflexia bacterium SDU3-3]
MSTAASSVPQTPVQRITKGFRANVQTYALLVALVAIWGIFFSATNGNYTTPQNISNLFRQMTVTSFLAVGMVLIIVTGNIDLSVGKLAGFVSVVVAFFQARIWPQVFPNQEVLTTVLSIVAGIGVGLLFGMLQGSIIAYLKVPSFIVTLGGMWILNGALLLVTEGKTIPANQPLFSEIAQGYLPPAAGWVLGVVVAAVLFVLMVMGRQRKQRYGLTLEPMYMDALKTGLVAALVLLYVGIVNQYNGVQTPVLLLAIAAVVMSYVSDNTRFGRYAYAIGGNREAARLSGVNIRKNIFLIYVLMGFLCGISGTVLASYVGYGTIAAGQGYELDAIASCVLGGTSTLGGSGTILGAIIGSLIMSSLTNGLQMMNVQPAWQYLLKGAVLVAAVYADVYFKKSR